jgi:hypothetical protein
MTKNSDVSVSWIREPKEFPIRDFSTRELILEMKRRGHGYKKLFAGGWCSYCGPCEIIVVSENNGE